MTDSIGPVNRTLEVLRRHIAEHARQLDSSGKSSQVSDSAADGATARRGEISDLRQRVAERLRAIDPADPNAVRRQRRVFLESVLAWEFGEELLNDPQLDDIVDKLEANFADNPDLERSFRAALQT